MNVDEFSFHVETDIFLYSDPPLNISIMQRDNRLKVFSVCCTKQYVYSGYEWVCYICKKTPTFPPASPTTISSQHILGSPRYSAEEWLSRWIHMNISDIEVKVEVS